MFNLIILLIITSILNIQSYNYDFDLENGVSKHQRSSLLTNNTYRFFIQAKQFQNATFLLYIDYHNRETVNIISVEEYSDRNNAKPNKEQNLTIHYIFRTSVSNYATSSYIVSLSNTSYIAFKIVPKIKISYYDVKIDVINGMFFLSSGEEKLINKAFPGGTYIFYIKAYEQQKVNITLSTDYINYNPFNSVFIYQYQYKNETLHYTASRFLSSISNKKTNNQLISFYSYLVSSDKTYLFSQTNYLALRIVPNNISYFIVKIDNPIEYYDLNNGIQKAFYNLKSNTTYIFYGEAKPFQLAKIYCETNNLSTKPFDNIIIYELRTKTYDYYNIKGNEPISFTPNNKKSSISTSYEISNSYTKLLAFRIKPLYDIDYITVKISIQGSYYYLYDGETKNITSLNYEGQYIIFIRTSLYDVINFNLTTNYVEKPLSKITIFESSTIDAGFTKNISLSMKYSKQNNQLISINSYIASNYYTSYLRIKIIPNDNIKYILAKANIVKTLFTIWEKSSKLPFNNLISEYNYYARMYTIRNEKSLKITLDMSYKDYMPFDYIYLCESSRQCDDFKIKIHYKDMEIKIEKEKIIASFFYQTSKNEFNYLYLRFSPKYNIRIN